MNEDYFKKFNDLILQLASQFFVWEYLYIKNKQNISAYNLRSHFWIPVLLSLFDDFLLLLANIFDKNSGKVLSVYQLLNNLPDKNKNNSLLSEIKKYDEVIKQIIKWRGNCLAHKNIYFTQNPDQLAKKFPIRHEKVKELINLLIKIIHETNQDFNGKHNITNYYNYYKEVEKNCINDTQFVIDYGLHTLEYKKLMKKNWQHIA